MAKILNTPAVDELFLQILNDLLKDVIHTSDHAAEKILDLSSELVGKDVLSGLIAFHTLYTDENIDQIKNDFNRQIDDILATPQQYSEQDSEQDNDDVFNAGASLAELQVQLEKTINIDAALKQKTAPILHAIQFSELIHRHIANIERAWRFTVEKISTDEPVDYQSIAIDIDSLLTTHFERKAFNQHVLKMDLLLESEEEVDHLLNAIIS